MIKISTDPLAVVGDTIVAIMPTQFSDRYLNDFRCGQVSIALEPRLVSLQLGGKAFADGLSFHPKAFTIART